MGDAEKKPRLVGLAEAIAECDAAQALVLFQWATRLERAASSVRDPALPPAPDGSSLAELYAVARELREAGEGLRGHAAATLDRLKLKARDTSPVVR